MVFGEFTKNVLILTSLCAIENSYVLIVAHFLFLSTFKLDVNHKIV